MNGAEFRVLRRLMGKPRSAYTSTFPGGMRDRTLRRIESKDMEVPPELEKVLLLDLQSFYTHIDRMKLDPVLYVRPGDGQELYNAALGVIAFGRRYSTTKPMIRNEVDEEDETPWWEE